MSTRALPDHGTYSRYIGHACRCEPCREAGRTYRRRLGYDRVNGVSRRVDPTQTRNHAERLTARGWTQTQIAAAAGLNSAQISEVLSGRYATVRRRTAAAILNIPLDAAPPIPRRVIDATGTRRRLQALMVLGHTLPEIAAQSGAGVSSLQQTVDGRWNRIHATTAGKVARVYRQLSLHPAPPARWAEQARNNAMANGWHGPMAWEDIDDPACVPDPDVPTAPAHVHPDDVAELVGQGLSDVEIGRRLGLSPRTVLRARTALKTAEVVRIPVVPKAARPRARAECGTRSGYQQHRRDGEDACQPCRQANTDADNRLRRTGATRELVS
jgi:transcriptional regulator with XRE-family HTH domain